MPEGTERRRSADGMIAQLAALEERSDGMERRLDTIAERIEVVAKRTHDLTAPLAILIDGADRNDRYHAEMLAEVRAARNESAAAMHEHDARDDTRFANVDHHLSQLAVLHATEEERKRLTEKLADRENEHRQEHRTILHNAFWLLSSAIIGAVVLAVGERWIGK